VGAGWKQSDYKEEKTLVVSCTDIELQVYAEKNKYMVISGDQNTGQNQTIKTANPLKGWNSSNI
jgi:hypothetical protein